MRLPFDSDLIVTSRFDPETAALADHHYSRQKPGTPQFMPNGSVIVIRNNEGTLVFGWLYQQIRMDKQSGYCCSIFRNESDRRSSDVILECEQIASERWGQDRAFTYVRPDKIKSANPGFCFKQAGWRFDKRTKDGKHLLVKDVISEGAVARG